MSRHPLRSFAAAAVLTTLFAAPAALAGDPKNALVLLPVDHWTLGNNGESQILRFGLEFEHMAGPATGFFINGGVLNPLASGQPLDLTLDLGVRFYPFSPAPRWFFIGPTVGLAYINDATEHGFTNAKVMGFRVGAALGVNVLLADLFLITVSGGGEYYRDYVYDLDSSNIPTLAQDLRLSFRGGVGLAF